MSKVLISLVGFLSFSLTAYTYTDHAPGMQYRSTISALYDTYDYMIYDEEFLSLELTASTIRDIQKEIRNEKQALGKNVKHLTTAPVALNDIIAILLKGKGLPAFCQSLGASNQDVCRKKLTALLEKTDEIDSMIYAVEFRAPGLNQVNLYVLAPLVPYPGLIYRFIK